ncbi:MAG: acyltransferase [Deltaproteobacteria bacterium]|nr:MAG: acyltransferase [Deltaproteobacteria bacterium]
MAKSVLKRLVGAWYRWRVRARAASVGPRLLVWGATRVSRQTVIGSHCNFNGMRIRGDARVEIGDYFHSGDGCQIITHVHNYEGEAIPYDSTMINKDVVIEPFVWLGSNVLILGGVRIGEGAIIQAGAVVVRDIPRCAIAGGNPATVFKMRDVERFDRLKAEGKFH